MKQGFHAEEASQRPFPTQRSVKSRKVLDGWRTIESRKKRNALLISFRLCRLKFSLETFCLRLWEEGREFETATGSIPRNVEDFWPTPGERMGEGLECYGLWKG